MKHKYCAESNIFHIDKEHTDIECHTSQYQQRAHCYKQHYCNLTISQQPTMQCNV